MDAGTTPADTSLAAVDVGTDAPSLVLDAGACAPSDVLLGVRVEPVTADVGRCQTTHADHAALRAIEAAPADDGIRLHFDLCPAADADCRCDVVVTHVGTDIANDLHPDLDVTLDVAPGEVASPGAFVAITKIPTCQCDGCGCSEPLYLYAANDNPDSARLVPAPMTFARGVNLCPMVDCAFGGSWELHARGDGGESDVPGGTERDVGSVHVRSLRDVGIWAPCAACAGCDTPVSAWIAWVSS